MNEIRDRRSERKKMTHDTTKRKKKTNSSYNLISSTSPPQRHTLHDHEATQTPNTSQMDIHWLSHSPWSNHTHIYHQRRTHPKQAKLSSTSDMQQARHTSNNSLKYIHALRRVRGDGSGLWTLRLLMTWGWPSSTPLGSLRTASTSSSDNPLMSICSILTHHWPTPVESSDNRPSFQRDRYYCCCQPSLHWPYYLAYFSR